MAASKIHRSRSRSRSRWLVQDWLLPFQPFGLADLLPPVHTDRIVASYYVDPVSGNDSTGTGTSGNPWQTLEGAVTNLRTASAGAPAAWAPVGDVALYLKAGTYQAGSGAQQTVEVTFNNAARAPHETRWLLIRPDTGVARADVVIKPPAGGTGAKYAIKTYDQGTAWFGSFVQVRGVAIDGENTRRGGTDVVGVYVNQTSDFEIVGCEIKGLQAADTSGVSSKAQGIYAEATSPKLKVVGCLIHDIGTTTGTINAQEHGIYFGGDGCTVAGNIVYNVVNGFGVQAYNSGNPINRHAIVANTVYGTVEKSCLIIPGNSVGAVIANNILKNATQYGVEFLPATFTGSGNLWRANITHGNTSGARSHTGDRAGWTFINELTGDPLLTSPPTDMTPGVGSPAIDAAYIEWAPLLDIDGTVRSGAADIGAVEYVASGATTVPVGTATETDSALAAARRKTRGSATAIETDAAPAATRRKSKAVGVASETDAGLGATRRKVHTIGVATETDGALTITAVGDTVVPVGTATEPDAALAAGRVKMRAVGVAAETGAATAATRRKTRAAGTAVESDAAVTAGRVSRTQTGVASEADSSLAATRRKTRAAGVAAGTDIGLTAARRKVKAVGVAAEVDAAQTVSRAEPGVNTATETDSVPAIARRKVKAVGVATETGSPVVVVRSHRKQVGTAAGVDGGLPVLRLRRLTVGAALEASEAEAATRVKRLLTGLPVETDSALAVEFAGAVVIVTGRFDSASPVNLLLQANARGHLTHDPTILNFDAPRPRRG